MVYRAECGAVVCEMCQKYDWQLWILNGIQILDFLHMVRHQRACPGPVITPVEDSLSYALQYAEAARIAAAKAREATANNHHDVARFVDWAETMAHRAATAADEYRADVDAARAAHGAAPADG